mgnify:CR=1 FL=1
MGGNTEGWASFGVLLCWMSYKNYYICTYVRNVRTNLKENELSVKK